MRIPHAALPGLRLGAIAVFTVFSAVFFAWLWVNSGGRLPWSANGYRVSFDTTAVSNLVADSDVMIAGVPIGKVVSVTVDGGDAHVTVHLNSSVAPLHRGAAVQIRQKTLIEETYLEVTDGTGPALSNGVQLPSAAAKPAVELNDVLTSISGGTRKELASLLQYLGGATKNTSQGVSDALAGAGDLGRQGSDALHALASQSADLKQLTGDAATLVAALDTRQGQIAELVSDASSLTAVTAGGSAQIKSTMRELPALLSAAQAAGGSLSTLAANLSPLVSSLNRAAPDLNTALDQLPTASANLRALLPALNGVLTKAPATLDRIPAVAADTHQLLPTLNVALGDLNPMLAYMQPYGHDIAAFFTNFGQTIARGDVNGNELRAFVIFNEQSVRGLPMDLNSVGVLNKNNPYPKAGGATRPGPFTGTYPRVARAN